MDQHQIWSHFQNNRPEVFAQAEPRYRFLALRARGEKVLNIGVGNGGLERKVAGMGSDVYSLDPGWEVLARTTKAGKGVAGSIGALPFKNAVFDTVICSEVLEHLNDELLLAGLAEINRVVKPGGAFIGTVPADEILSNSEVMCPSCGTLFHRWGHLQSFSPSRLDQLLHNFGPVRIERRLFVHWPSLNWKGKFVALLRVTMNAFGHGGGEHNLYFHVQKQS